MTNIELIKPELVSAAEWQAVKCDKTDYLIAGFCGAVAGLIDAFFVGDPVSSMLGNSTDKAADHLVK